MDDAATVTFVRLLTVIEAGTGAVSGGGWSELKLSIFHNWITFSRTAWETIKSLYQRTLHDNQRWLVERLGLIHQSTKSVCMSVVEKCG
jgi:hypothetical protein